jgi:hypothetical protein
MFNNFSLIIVYPLLLYSRRSALPLKLTLFFACHEISQGALAVYCYLLVKWMKDSYKGLVVHELEIKQAGSIVEGACYKETTRDKNKLIAGPTILRNV